MKLRSVKIINLIPIDIKTFNKDSLSFYIKGTFYNYTFNPQQSTVNTLTNTSGFEIISNLELRELLQKWEELVKDYQEEEIMARYNYINQLKPFEKKHFNYNSNPYKYLTDPRVDLSILQTLEFDNYVQDRQFALNNILDNSYGELDALIHTIDKIIELSEAKNND